MKRSEINKLITEAQHLFDRVGFKLPPFAHWTPQEWKSKGREADEIRDNALGWDVTDFGLGEFEKNGLLLFTIRNGNYNKPDAYPKPYAEKIMVVKENQVTPTHFHWKKEEDIINRGGGELVLELYRSTSDERLSDESFSVSLDGVRKQCHPGERIVLHPGESITLEPFVYHRFYAAPGKGTVVVGEVSAVNDDAADNRFLDPIGRFPKIEEDEAPVRLLCNEYPPANGKNMKN